MRLLCILGLFLCWPLAALGEIELQQADGSLLTLHSPAARVVTFSPHLTELVFAAGAGAELVATVEYSEYPEAAAQIPRIGDAFRLDIERVVALRPDLVIAWDSGNPGPAITQLKTFGIPVWSVEIREPGQIADVLEAIGAATGRSEVAAPQARKIRQRLAALSARYEGVSTLEYFYQVDAKPLFTINGDHLISKGLSLCGAHNVFDAESGLAFQVGHEAVIVADPDALLAPSVDGMPDPLATWRDWPAMRAVQHEALFLLPADPVSRATPRFLDSLEFACKLMHRLRNE